MKLKWTDVADRLEETALGDTLADGTRLQDGQRAALLAICERLRGGQRALLLADEVGMGKTLIEPRSSSRQALELSGRLS